MEEILHNQLRLGSLPMFTLLFTRFYTSQVGGAGSLNHQQYHKIKMVIQNNIDMYNSIDRYMWYIYINYIFI